MEIHIWWLVASWSMIPLAMFVWSRVEKPIFTQRYFLPMLVPVSFASAILIARACPLLTRPRALKGGIAWIVLAALIAGLAFFDHRSDLQRRRASRSAYAAEMASAMPAQFPVVFESAQDFAELLPRSGSAIATSSLSATERYIFLFGWSEALATPLPATVSLTDDHLMENWKKVGYYSAQIQDAGDVLRQRKAFVLVADDAHAWITRALVAQGTYKLVQAGRVRKGVHFETIWIAAVNNRH